MTYVVTENCIACKYTDCVEVCPVDCFYEGPNFLVIHPDECIDCALCEPECPAEAIFSEDEIPSAHPNITIEQHNNEVIKRTYHFPYNAKFKLVKKGESIVLLEGHGTEADITFLIPGEYVISYRNDAGGIVDFFTIKEGE